MFHVVLFVEEDSWVLGLGLGTEEVLCLLTDERFNRFLGVDHSQGLGLLENLVSDLVGQTLLVGCLGVSLVGTLD